MKTKATRNSYVRALYPDAWKRVRAVCQFGSASIDLDDHAARIVLAAKELRFR